MSYKQDLYDVLKLSMPARGQCHDCLITSIYLLVSGFVYRDPYETGMVLSARVQGHCLRSTVWALNIFPIAVTFSAYSVPLTYKRRAVHAFKGTIFKLILYFKQVGSMNYIQHFVLIINVAIWYKCICRRSSVCVRH